jgi:hypothetical protein
MSLSHDKLEGLPRFELISSLTNIPNLAALDIENNLQTDINFDYYTSQEFCDCQAIKHAISKDPFSVFHCNVRSLNANLENLLTLLADLHHKFSLIGLSETKINVHNDPLTNLIIPGYQFISQPSMSNAGGVGFYVRDSIEFHLREDLSSLTEDFECLWIEVHSKSRNILCSAVYHHPNSNVDNFISYFTAIIDKISTESKLCISIWRFQYKFIKF